MPHKTLRVLAVTNIWPTATNGVRGIFVREQVEALRRQGVHVDVEVVAQDRGKADYLLAAGRVRQRAHSGNYDLMHVHYGLTAISAMLTDAIPGVLTVYGSDVNIGWQRALTRIAGRRLPARIYVSKNLAVTARDPAPHIIPNGVDLNLFTPIDRQVARARLDINPADRVVLFGGRPSNAVKGYDVFTDSSPSRDAIPLRFAAADALLFTSRQGSEGSPGVVKEAAAMGLPVVSVDIGDVAEQLAGVSPSAVVPFPWTREALVADLATKTAEILNAGKRSNGRVNLHGLDWASTAAAIIEVYHQVLKIPVASAAR